MYGIIYFSTNPLVTAKKDTINNCKTGIGVEGVTRVEGVTPKLFTKIYQQNTFTTDSRTKHAIQAEEI